MNYYGSHIKLTSTTNRRVGSEPFGAIKILGILWLALVFQTQVMAQEIIKQGRLSIQESGLSEKLDGRRIVPPLEENDGIVIIKVENNKYFTIENVLTWLQEGRFVFLDINYSESGLQVRPDGTIRVRFEWNFLPGQDVLARKVQLSKLDKFNNYYTSHRFYKQQIITYTLKVEEPPVFDEKTVASGIVNLYSNVDGVEVIFLNRVGERISSKFITEQTTQFEVPVGEYQILLRKSGFADSEVDVTVEEGSEIRRDVELIRDGQPELLQISTMPTNASVFMNDQRVGTTPLRYTQLERKLYTIKVVLPDHKTIERKADFRIQNELMLDEKMVRSYIDITSVPGGATVTINDDTVGVTPFHLSSPSWEELTIGVQKEWYQPYQQKINVEEEKIVQLDVKLEKRESEARFVSGFSVKPRNITLTGVDGETAVSDGKKVVSTFDVPFGDYYMVVKKPGYKTLKRTISIEKQMFEYDYQLEKKSKLYSIGLSALFPGTGQLYWGHNKRGLAFLVTGTAALGGVIYGKQKYSTQYNEYEHYRDVYLSATKQSEIDVAYEVYKTETAELNKYKDQMLFAAAVAGSAYLLNVVDRLLVTTIGNRNDDSGLFAKTETGVRLQPGGITMRVSF